MICKTENQVTFEFEEADNAHLTFVNCWVKKAIPRLEKGFPLSMGK